jgi:hypothetical protein
MSMVGTWDDRSAAPLPWWDLPARAVATGALVLALTAAAAQLGPSLTGVLAPFPLGTSVVAAFALAQGGSSAAVATLRGVLRGLWGLAAFCFLVALLAEPLGGAAAFIVATAGALAVQLVSRRARAMGITVRSVIGIGRPQNARYTPRRATDRESESPSVRGDQ